MLRATILGLFLFAYSFTFGQLKKNAIKGAIQVEVSTDTCYAYASKEMSIVENKNPRIKAYRELLQHNAETARLFQNNLATAQIEINYSSAFEGNTKAKEAFRFAADLWEMELISPVPIVIVADIQNLGEGTIGQNSSNRVTNVPNAPDPTLVYVSSLGNAIAGEDLLPGQPDLIQTYNSEFDFYYGIDGNTPTSKTDFVTIAFHEIGHGLGITGSTNSGSGVGLNFGENPMSWDFFVVNGDDVSILDLGFSSSEQTQALISDNLYINSYNSVKALNGELPKIYAPEDFNAGSSFSHWDEKTFSRGSSNSLMSPFIGSGEAIHDPGDITRGILQDMGWQLVSQVEFDLGIVDIIGPNSAVGLDHEAVTIVVQNFGIKSVNNVQLSYSINGGSVVTEIFKNEIHPNEKVTLIFNQPIDLAVPGETVTIEVSVNYFIDEYIENNKLSKTVTNLLPVDDYPYMDSFEGNESGWTVEGDDNVWERGVPLGVEISAASEGNFAWVTNLEGNYPNSSSSYLISPVYNFAGKHDPIIEFDIHYNLEFGWDGLSLQMSLDNGSSWQTVGNYNDGDHWYTDGNLRNAALDGSEGDNGIDALSDEVDSGEGWTGNSGGYVRASHLLTDAGGEENVILRFVMASDLAINAEGAAIDNLKITALDVVPDDLSIMAIDEPVTGDLTSAENIKVKIKNFGTNAAKGFSIGYKINNEPVVLESFPGTIESGNETIYSFTKVADLSERGQFKIKAFTVFDADEIHENDSIAKIIESIDIFANFPYQESFEQGEGAWTGTGTNSSWELSIPSGEVINSASDGNNAWVTNTAGHYNNNEISFLRSPVFDLTAMSRPVLAFDVWYETEKQADAVFLEYSIDEGKSWNFLFLDRNSYNSEFYNNPINNTAEAFSGSSNGYRTVVADLQGLRDSKNALLRFVFVSDNKNTSEGIAVDNIRIFDGLDVNFNISCAPAIKVANEPGKNVSFVVVPNPSIDQSGSPVFTNTFTHTNDASAAYPIGTTEVTFIVDLNGQIKTCNTKVTVVDVEPPKIFCPEDKVIATTDENPVVVNYNTPKVNDNYGFINKISYSNEQEVDGKSGIACPNGPNSFIRVFELKEDFNIQGDFKISGIDMGVQVVNAGDVQAEGNKVPVTVNLYSFDSEKYSEDNPEELVFENMILLNSRKHFVQIGLKNEIVNFPIDAIVPEGFSVVVEFLTEAGSDQFFPGANPDQKGESYILAPNCGINNIMAVSSPELNFPEAQWVMNINGLNENKGEPTFVTGIRSGENFPFGTTTVKYAVSDITGFTDTCTFNVHIVEESLEPPTDLVISDITSDGFSLKWSPVSGTSTYQVVVSEDNFTTLLDNYNDFIVSGTSINITGLKKNTAYYVQVRTIDDSQNPTSYSKYTQTKITSTLIEAPYLSPPVYVTDSLMRIVWEKVDNIDIYKFQISLDDFISFRSFTVEGNEIIIDNLNQNSTYSYRVKAINAGGESKYSNIGNGTTLPSSPKNLPAVNTSTFSFTAIWEDVVTAEYYLLDVSTNNFKSFVHGYNSIKIDQESTVVMGLECNTNYQYRVRSYSSIGGESLNSNIIRVTTLAEVPTALDPENIASYGATARWTSTGASFYELDLTADNFSSFILNEHVVENNTEKILNLESDKMYEYQVRAVNRKGKISSSSNSISFTTDPATLAIPENLYFSDIGTHSFKASWNQVPEALFYIIQLSDDNFLTVSNEVKVFDNSIIITNLEDDKHYSFRVKALNNNNSSPFTEDMQLKTILGFQERTSFFSYYPNPVQNQLNIASLQGEVKSIRLFTINGNEEKISYFRNNLGLYTVRMSGLPQGIYILHITDSNNGVNVIKVIKK